MCIAHCHLLANPHVLERLRAELRTLPIPASLAALEQSPHLNAEANRLSFGITGRNCRVAPDGTLQYKSHTIPAGRPMSMSSLCVHTNEDIFPHPRRVEVFRDRSLDLGRRTSLATEILFLPSYASDPCLGQVTPTRGPDVGPSTPSAD